MLRNGLWEVLVLVLLFLFRSWGVKITRDDLLVSELARPMCCSSLFLILALDLSVLLWRLVAACQSPICTIIGLHLFKKDALFARLPIWGLSLTLSWCRISWSFIRGRRFYNLSKIDWFPNDKQPLVRHFLQPWRRRLGSLYLFNWWLRTVLELAELLVIGINKLLVYFNIIVRVVQLNHEIKWTSKIKEYCFF